MAKVDPKMAQNAQQQAGAPVKKSKWWLWLILILIVAGVIIWLLV